jgi:hypothetical protein
MQMAVRRGFRNWVSRFEENFGIDTKLSHVSAATLALLAQGREEGTFYLYDLILNLEELGTGFDFHELKPNAKMAVMDRHIFLLDRIRFECMKRLGWLENYPGEENTLVELITQFDSLGPNLQAKVPRLSRKHPDYDDYRHLNVFDQETFVRKMIPRALQEIQDSAETL